MQIDPPIKPRRSLWERILAGWNPKPVDPPKVDPDLSHLSPLQRSTESIRYSILSTEFWISPNGQVREWLRHNSRLAIVLAMPAFFVIPIITFVLWQLVKWLGMLTSIAGNLILLPILALLAALAIAAVRLLLKAIFGG